MLNSEIINAMPVSGDEKKILFSGEAAEAFMAALGWKMLLDWAEERANRSLARLKDARWASPEVKAKLSDKWHDDEEWLTQVQVHFQGMVADRDALIQTYANIEQDIRSRDTESPVDHGVYPREGEG